MLKRNVDLLMDAFAQFVARHIPRETPDERIEIARKQLTEWCSVNENQLQVLYSEKESAARCQGFLIPTEMHSAIVVTKKTTAVLLYKSEPGKDFRDRALKFFAVPKLLAKQVPVNGFVIETEVYRLLRDSVTFQKATPHTIAALEFSHCTMKSKDFVDMLTQVVGKYEANEILKSAISAWRRLYNFAMPADDVFKQTLLVSSMITEVQRNSVSFLTYLKEWKNANSVFNDRIYETIKEVIFKVLWTLEQLARICVVHNDLHTDNILVRTHNKIRPPETYVSSTNPEWVWTFQSPRVDVWLYDFDRATVVSQTIPKNPVLTAGLCADFGQCREYRPSADKLFFLLRCRETHFPDFLSIELNNRLRSDILDPILSGINRNWQSVRDFVYRQPAGRAASSLKFVRGTTIDNTLAVTDQSLWDQSGQKPFEKILETVFRLPSAPGVTSAHTYTAIEPGKYKECLQRIDQSDKIHSMIPTVKGVATWFDSSPTI